MSQPFSSVLRWRFGRHPTSACGTKGPLHTGGRTGLIEGGSALDPERGTRLDALFAKSS